MALNKELQEQVDVLQGGIIAQADKQLLPERFKISAMIDKSPRMCITDTETGRTSIISFYAYSQVRATLNDLFGE